MTLREMIRVMLRQLDEPADELCQSPEATPLWSTRQGRHVRFCFSCKKWHDHRSFPDSI